MTTARAHYLEGLIDGMMDLEDDTYLQLPGDGSLWTEGYRDAIDDSDYMPDPFDPQETIVT